jgi:xylulokinase
VAQFIVAHDVGTSGNKAVLVDTAGQVHATAIAPYPVHFPCPDWAEQDPQDWWQAVALTTRQVVERSKIDPRDVAAMVFTTQMLGIVPMGSKGAPMRPAIIWLDSRAPEQAASIMRKFLGARVFALLAGAEISGKDALPKLLWLKQNEPTLYRDMNCFLDVNGYLTYRATGKMLTEWSCASAIGFDLKKKDWLRGLIGYMGMDLDKFPQLVRSIDRAGTLTSAAASECGLLEGTPVYGGGGDAPSAAIGAGAVGEGEGHVYLGTSGWGGVTTHKTPTGKGGIATLQGSDPSMSLLLAEMETAGACLKWIADQFYKAEQADPNVPNVYALMDQKVGTISPGSNYVVCTPWLYGERAPVSDTFVRATFFNISADHTREHLLRAVYEGVAYNLRWMLDIVEKSFGFPLPVLRIIGGGARGGPWMQIIADVTGRRVETVVNSQEAGAVGAALTAAVGLGIYPDFASLKRIVLVDRQFEPEPENAEVYNLLYDSYRRLYRSLRGLYRDVNQVRFRACAKP